MNVNDIEMQLEKIYVDGLKEFNDAEKTSEKPTTPLMLSIPIDYDKKIKIMLFGQETNDWRGLYSENISVKNNMSGYYDFWVIKNSEFSKVGPLLQTFNKFQKDIDMDKTSCIWNNIIKIGKAKEIGTPSAELIERQESWFKVVRKEVDILKPNIILFFTGPNYDGYIKEVFGEFDKEEVIGQKTRQLSKLIFQNDKNIVAYRTYHPGYLRRSGLGKEYLNFFKQVVSDITI